MWRCINANKKESTLDHWLVAYALIGIFVGIFAGMLGIGGGAIVVPLMTDLFRRQGFDSHHVLHVALGTCMATIVLTSASSLRAHHRHGAVDWPVVRAMTPGLIVGGFAGSWLARYIPTFPLAIVFAVFVTYSATQMLVGWKPRPGAHLPGPFWLFVAGFLVCAFSALVAIGGAALTIPFLVFCAMPFHRAIGTAAALGFPIAVAGTLGFIVNGWSIPDLPSPHLGYVYLPAFAALAVTSVLFAPLGARFAHRSAAFTLRRIFAVVMYAMVIKLIVDLM